MIEVTTDKTKRLANLEKDIEKSKNEAEKHWYEIGRALCKIRDDKLHKQQTFEQYCLQRWGFKRARAYQLCRGFETVKQLRDSSNMSTIVDKEAHARELAAVPEADRPKVLEDAKKNGKVTAKSIKTAARKVRTIDVIEKDKTDYPIPELAMPVWNRRDEVKDKLRSLYELRQWATDMQGNEDPLYAEVVFSALKLDIESVIQRINGAVPYAVCPACQGQTPKTCTFCKGRAMVSKFLYHGVAVPEEMKAIRKAVASAS